MPMARRWDCLPALATAVLLLLMGGAALAAPSTAMASGVPATGTPPTYQWPEAHQNKMLTGVAVDPSINATNASSLGVRWMTYTGSEILSSPVVAWNATLQKTLVVVGNDAGYLTAYDQATGLPVWSVNLGGSVRSTSLVSGPYLWTAPTTGGRAYKLNAATGATVCSAPIQNATGETVDASPVMATPPGGQPTVYFAENDTGDNNGPVTALNAANCAVDFQSAPEPKPGVGGVWDFLSYGGEPETVRDWCSSAPRIRTPRSMRLMPSRARRCGDSRRTTRPHTLYDVGAGLTVSPPGDNGFADGVVYFANKYGIMYAVDLTTGAEIWEYNFGAQTGLSPTGALDTAALSGTNLVFGDTGGVWDLNAVERDKAVVPLKRIPRRGRRCPGHHRAERQSGRRGLGPHRLNGRAVAGRWLAALHLPDRCVQRGVTRRDGWQHHGRLGKRVRLRLCPRCRNRQRRRRTAVAAPVDQSTIANPNGPVTVSGDATAGGPISAVTVSIQRDGAGGAWWDGASGVVGRQSIPQPGSADHAGIHFHAYGRAASRSPRPEERLRCSPAPSSTAWPTLPSGCRLPPRPDRPSPCHPAARLPDSWPRSRGSARPVRFRFRVRGSPPTRR